MLTRWIVYMSMSYGVAKQMRLDMSVEWTWTKGCDFTIGVLGFEHSTMMSSYDESSWTI